MGTLLHSCVEVCEPIELSLRVVSVVGRGVGVLNRLQMPQGEWGFRSHGLNGVFFEQKCTRLVREKLTMFPYGNKLLETPVHWLSTEIVRFQIDVGVFEKFAKM